LPKEIANCRPYLLRELELLKRVRVIVALGRLAFDTAMSSVGLVRGYKRRPQFAHAAECELSGGITLLASYHPSQQNTFTGRLTEPMFDRVFSRARRIIGSAP
jgi:uracil-DNA glycosylase